MIKKNFLFPKCYVQKVPYCDKCDTKLMENMEQLITDPPQYRYTCPVCGKEYTFYDYEIRGEWKWRQV